MSTDPRDTQFAGFAKLLWDELPIEPEDDELSAAYDAWSDACEQIIARRAYDFAYHVVRKVIAMECTAEFVIRSELHEVPDLTTWPEEKTGRPGKRWREE